MLSLVSTIPRRGSSNLLIHYVVSGGASSFISQVTILNMEPNDHSEKSNVKKIMVIMYLFDFMFIISL